MSTNNEWIKEKKSWKVYTTPSGNGGFDPCDPICGRWTAAELERVFGTTKLTVLPLKGKWAGEVLIYNPALSETDAFENRLSTHLIVQSLGKRMDIYGDTLMTLTALVEEQSF
ncbi:MAG: hypothetical protein ACPGTU_06885 [Myxococcota bacterium]